jgi:nucleoside-diphosphate-sugar epimerase
VRILVTGATGFVGTAFVAAVVEQGRHSVRAVARHTSSAFRPGVEQVAADLAAGTNWACALDGVEAVLHLAARVHVMRDAAADPLAEFRRVNVEGTITLASQAAAAGVRRFVYLSSVKVHGESGTYSEDDPPAPEDAYGVSKHEAEVGLRQIAAATKMESVIIRPPLVYGPGVRANFQQLMRAVALGVPLPLGAVHNLRSLIGVDNLVDFMLTCLEHPAAAGETFLVSDGEDLSTTDLVRRIARAMDRSARLVPVPASALMAAATLIGRRDAARRVLGTLRVDITKARRRLAWTPPVMVDEGLRRTAVALR